MQMLMGKILNSKLFLKIKKPKRQCQIRVRFESRVETKFLEPLNQILKLKFLSPWFPCSHSFQKMYNTYMHPDIQKEKNWDNVKKIVISQGNFIKIFTL